MKKIVVVPDWADEVVTERLKGRPRGTLDTPRLRDLGVLVNCDPDTVTNFAADREEVEGEVWSSGVATIYVARHPHKGDSWMPDENLADEAKAYSKQIDFYIRSRLREPGVDKAEADRLKSLRRRLGVHDSDAEFSREASPLRIVARCIRNDLPESDSASGSHIFKVLARLAIAAFKEDEATIQRRLDEVTDEFERDRLQLLVDWHNVMVELSAVDLDLIALKRLMEGEDDANKRGREYLELMLARPPVGGFEGMARRIEDGVKALIEQWGREVEPELMRSIVELLDWLGRLGRGRPIGTNAVHSLVTRANEDGGYHAAVWKLSQALASSAPR